MAATHSEYRGYLRNAVDMEAGQHRFHPVQSSEPTYRPLLFGTLAVMGLLQVASSVAILLHLTGYLQEVGSLTLCKVIAVRMKDYSSSFSFCVNIYLQILSTHLFALRAACSDSATTFAQLYNTINCQTSSAAPNEVGGSLSEVKEVDLYRSQFCKSVRQDFLAYL